MIKKNISKSIKSQNWLVIEYRNQDDNKTNYWIAIKDFDFNKKTFIVSAFNMSKSTSTNNGVIEVEIFFDRILSAHVVPNTKYEVGFDLIDKIESNIELVKWLQFDNYKESTLDYIHQCMIYEETPYQDEKTLVSKIDQQSFEELKVKEKIFLNYDQVGELVSKLEVLSKQAERNHFETVTLALNMISISTNRGMYVVAYKEVYFDPIERSLVTNPNISFNYTFASDGENNKFTYKHNLHYYLDIEVEVFTDLCVKDIKKAIEMLEESVHRYGEELISSPYIMDLKRQYNKHIENEIDTIKLKKKNGVLNTPLKAFFGNMTASLLSGRIREVDVVLIDDKVNIDQLRVIYNSLTKPITYVQGPPGTGKTQTIINALISSYFNGDKVLVTSNNNKPINDIYNKLTTFKNSNNNKIFFPFLRLGNNDEVKESLNIISRNLPYISKQVIMEDLLDKHATHSKEEMIILNKLLAHYEKVTELEEEIDILKSVDDKLQDNLRMTSVKGLIEEKEKELKMHVKVADDAITKNIKKIDDRFLTWLSFTSIKYYKRIFEPKNKPLLTILKIQDEFTKIREFNKYLRDGENFKNFQNIFPIILTTNQSVHKLGVQKESFDLTIIDEAGQSSIGYSLFAIARAKRLLLVGDQNQLQPVISIATENNEVFMKKFRVSDNYNYLTNSILLSMQKSDPVSKFVLLSYHYRSHPDIINFSNRKYYKNQLKLPLKDRFTANALEHINVDTSKIGKPVEKNISLLEVDAIIRDIKANNYKKVGVITPYRNQANVLKNALKQENLDHVTVGTVHTFQGDEKDIIYFSSGITSKTHEKSFDWVKNNQELINVATTRAKNKLVIVSDKKEIIKRSKDRNDFFELHEYVIKNGKEVKLSEVNKTYFVNGANFKSYDTKKELEFFETINHLISTADKYKLEPKVRIASLLDKYSNVKLYDYGLKSEFDLVIFRIVGQNQIPVVVIELDGNEHYENEKVIQRDKLKQQICDENNIKLIRIDNKYSRRYLHIKSLLADILV